MKKHYQKPTTRNRLGLLQEEYISFLRVSKSALAMYETNKRSLPTWAMIKEAAIEICLDKPGKPKLEATVAPQQQETTQLLKHRQNECQLLLMRAERQLGKMKEKYGCCINMLHVAKLLPDLLPTLLPNNERQPQDLEWMEIYGNNALHELKTCNLTRQRLLELKINALKYEYNEVTALLEQA